MKALKSFVPVFVICLAIIGCAEDKGPTTRTSSMRDRQDDALRDPFGYRDDVPSVTGSKTGEFNRDAFNRDVDRVFNP
jgi:hypothetical protein